MLRNVFPLAALLVLSACASTPAPTNNTARVMTKFGLMGHMATDCSTPFGPGHSRYRALPDGRVEVTAFISAGGGRIRTTPNTMIIDWAEPDGPDKMNTRTTDSGNGQVFLTGWDKRGKEFRLMRSARPDGSFYFTNGTDGGYEYKWIHRCPN